MRVLVVSALLLLSVSAGAQDVESLPPLPPLNVPASGARLPGKVVWADLFTSDVGRARQFYEQVFGWEWRDVTVEPQHYGLLYKGGQRVAGIAHMDAPDGHSEYGRWVYFVSARDVRKTGSAIVAKGGEELLAPVSHAARGEFGIYAGAHQEVFGLMHSSSGDPGDHQARIGEWIWWQLFTPDVRAAASAYQDLFGYEATLQQLASGILLVHLSAHGYPRAVIGPLPDDPQASSTWVGFVRVHDVARTLEKVAASGGKVMLAPDPEILGGDIAVIADPLGTLLGLLRWDYPAQAAGTRP